MECTLQSQTCCPCEYFLTVSEGDKTIAICINVPKGEGGKNLFFLNTQNLNGAMKY